MVRAEGNRKTENGKEILKNGKKIREGNVDRMGRDICR